MMNLLILVTVIGSGIWTLIMFLPWRPWSTKERFDPPEFKASQDLSKVTVLIPARNEADTLPKTLAALNNQGTHLKVLIVDDQSTDGTREACKGYSHLKLDIIAGTELPAGWSGKLWALEQGLHRVDTDLVLLLDADIELKPRFLPEFQNYFHSNSLDLASIMANLRMESLVEKYLIPAFIYFFKLLYPFAIGNNPRSKLGVAAGGCILLKRSALQTIGGFSAIKGALIDDCTLAQKFKTNGFNTWIGLSRMVVSHREYNSLKDIWSMVTRTAFTQLNYSFVLLLICTFLMVATFLAPISLMLLASSLHHQLLGLYGYVLLAALYIPTLNYYGRSKIWALVFPSVGFLYLLMTWASAIRYFQGKRSEWKGRVYTKNVTNRT